MSAHWLDRPEAGGRLAIRLIGFVGLHCGRAFTRVFLYPITLYFYFRRGPERRAARDYFRRLTGGPGHAWQVLRLIHAFASTILDRVFLLARGVGAFRIRTRGVDELQHHLAGGRGVLLVGAHVGSFGVLRALAAEHPGRELRLVMDRSKTPALTALLEDLAPELAAGVIDTARGGGDVVLALSEAVRGGAMVALLGDRARPNEAMCEAPFLGGIAAFPVAPWQIAAALGVPVMLCLGMYRGGDRYDLVFETLAERVRAPRDARGPVFEAFVRHYALRLEHHLREAPFNWFNFYDFWQPQSFADEREPLRTGLRQVRAS